MGINRQEIAQNMTGRAQRRGPLRRLARRLGILTVLLAAAIIGGFLVFADKVTSYEPPETAKADAIVALTGGSQRLDQAIALLEEGAGKRLLISGVHPQTSAARIRSMTQSPTALFECCVDIGYEALDTVGNANEAVAWAHRNGFHSMVIVTNNYHMPRSLFELHRADPSLTLIAWPVVRSDLHERNWMLDPPVLRMMASEYAKLIGAVIRAYSGFSSTSGLRKESQPDPA